MLNALTSWLLLFALSASPTSQHAKLDPSPDVTLARYESIARDVAAVALDPAEPPISWIKGEQPRARTALLLMALAFHESRFWARVDEGRCAPHECDAYGDGRHAAWSVWQLHPESGFTFEGTAFRYANMRSKAWREEHAREIYDGPALIRDRKLAVMFAIRVLRASPYNWTTAKAAMGHAARWYSSRPFKGEWVVASATP